MIGNTLRHVTHVGIARPDAPPFLPGSASSCAGALPLPLFRVSSSKTLVLWADAHDGRAPMEPPRNAGRPRSTRSDSTAATPFPFPCDAERVDRAGALTLSASEAVSSDNGGVTNCCCC
ncbi:hypothetical protein B0F90DRAFT_1102710 [Multifurca ochricompacta]|uniref:Uncharacterized protein n=1 Tax=Multifurca ochricompacta TaxID=376703 RepID=A0AAD4M9G7_9AGAM|nr:hypothetical protein B0F90DRAFT_1102710 [Multifurca ochricompacta]